MHSHGNSRDENDLSRHTNTLVTVQKKKRKDKSIVMKSYNLNTQRIVFTIKSNDNSLQLIIYT